MLKGLRKEFNKLIGKEDVTMDKEVINPEASTVPVTAPEAAQTEVVAALTKTVAEQAEQLTAALANLETLQAQVKAAVDEKNALLAQIQDDKNKARMSVITDAVGDSKAQALFEATQNLGDAEFSAVVGALAGSVKVEANTPLFKELGASAETNVENIPEAVEESLEMKMLKAKYQNK